MSSRSNKRFNFNGNIEDEEGASYYVVNEDDDRIAGPFGSASYAYTVRDRIDPTLAEDPRVERER